MLAFGLFLILLFTLFLLSRVLHKDLSRVLYRLTKNKKVTIYTMAILFFPGTLIHEVAHYLMAKICFVHTGKMVLLPKITGDHVALGSVEIGQTDPFRRLLVGAAPFLVGTTLLFVTLIVAEQKNVWDTPSSLFLIIYILFELGNTMFSSRKDMEGALVVLLVFSVVGGSMYLLGFQLFDALKALFDDDGLKSMFQKGSLYLLYPLGVNGISIIILRLTQMIKR